MINIIINLNVVDCHPVSNCSSNGVCDETNGQCLCNVGYVPPCNVCEPNYYGPTCGNGTYPLIFFYYLFVTHFDY